MQLMTSFRAVSGHVFWPDDISLLDGKLIDGGRPLNSAQVTDSSLLALAVKHGGRLASLDRRLVTNAVPGGAKCLQLIE